MDLPAHLSLQFYRKEILNGQIAMKADFHNAYINILFTHSDAFLKVHEHYSVNKWWRFYGLLCSLVQTFPITCRNVQNLSPYINKVTFTLPSCT